MPCSVGCRKPGRSKRKNAVCFPASRQLLADGTFSCYLVMLIGALAGIAVFEASCGVLMGGVLGLSGLTVSILFILPIPAAFFVPGMPGVTANPSTA
ncbi:Multidrug resistance protein D [Serratia fonticola]|uniref:Multidrug resistance protein D n=1 Tax=Serratia fonticola TaxID=47917 RepID=A0A4U9TS51_SERFO|nr:Multidrug resistance protein D [Serratia fonticola]